MNFKINQKFSASSSLSKAGACLAVALASPLAYSASYTIDSSHTYPAFEADHLGGVSKWRGKINKSSGTLEFDAKAKTGKVVIEIDMASIDFGFGKMNEHAVSADIFDVSKYPTAKYESTKFVYVGNALKQVQGNLTLKGVTKPVTLTVHEQLCKMHPLAKKEVCGADASAVINRADFGVDYGLQMGFKPEVKLLISIEALKND